MAGLGFGDLTFFMWESKYFQYLFEDADHILTFLCDWNIIALRMDKSKIYLLYI